MTACLWWLYFRGTAVAAGEALGRVPAQQRGRVGSDAYSLTHFLLIAGIIYISLGIEQVLDRLAHGQPRHSTSAPLDWTSTVALYGGAALYLAGRVAFRRLSVQETRPAQVVAVGLALVLLPVSRILPPLAALGLLAALLVAVLAYEWWRGDKQDPVKGSATDV